MARASTLLAFFGILGAGVALVPAAALGAAVQHTTLASFQQAARADLSIETFDGTDDTIPAPLVFAGSGGYSFSVGTTSLGFIYRRSAGVSAQTDQGMVFTFTGRPVTAFAGTLRVASSVFPVTTVAGNVSVQTNTGVSFSVSVPVGGTFFGFTTTEPVSSLTFTDAAGTRYEFIDDVRVGTSVAAAATAGGGADRCDDAPVLTLIDGTVFPFTTDGATAQQIDGVCDNSVDTGPDVWFRYVATSSGTLTATTCGCTFDSILRVFGSCLIAGSGVHLACNDDFCTGGLSVRASRVQLHVDAGSDYLIRISGYAGASGSGNLTLTQTNDCAADFNHNGAVQVQDIFDFLSAWFAGCP